MTKRADKDVDLTTEEIYLPNGQRLTEEVATEIAEDALAHHYRVRGRPSLTGRAEHSPRLTVRIVPETQQALERIAAAQGRRVTDVARAALDEYVERHAS